MGVQWGYSRGIVGVQEGYSRVQWGYTGGTMVVVMLLEVVVFVEVVVLVKGVTIGIVDNPIRLDSIFALSGMFRHV